MKIRNGSIELNVVTDGDEAAPPLLILHGIINSADTWDWFVPALAERYRVVRLEFRGHGDSDRAPGQYSSSGYISDAVAVAEALGQPVLLLGHSLGGATAAALTQQRPDLVRAAAMEDPPLGLTEGAGRALEGNALLDAFTLMRQSIPQLQEAGVTREALAGILTNAPASSGGTFGDLLHPDGISNMAAGMLKVDASVLDPVLNNEVEAFVDPTQPLGVPSLILCADPTKPDAVADPELARRFAALADTTRAPVEVTVVDGAGHLIHDGLSSRDTFAAAVLAFFDRAG